MLFIVQFTDRPDALAIRQQYLQAHLAWLTEHEKTVLVGGSLRREENGPGVGGLWIVEAQSRLEIEALLDTDPFWKNGLRQSVEIFHWSKAFPDKKALV